MSNEYSPDNVVVTFKDNEGNIRVLEACTEIVKREPWYYIEEVTPVTTILHCKTLQGSWTTLSFYNDAEGLKTILDSNPYGEPLVSLKRNKEVCK